MMKTKVPKNITKYTNLKFSLEDPILFTRQKDETIHVILTVHHQ